MDTLTVCEPAKDKPESNRLTTASPTMRGKSRRTVGLMEIPQNAGCNSIALLSDCRVLVCARRERLKALRSLAPHGPLDFAQGKLARAPIPTWTWAGPASSSHFPKAI